MKKFVLHYSDETLYEVEAENKALAVEKADEMWAERTPDVCDETEKSWEQQKRTVSLTNGQWNRLATYLLMTTRYREGELEAWEKLSTEKNEDGTLAFPKAQSNIEYWQGMIRDIENIRESIDGTSLGKIIARATEKANETNSIGSKDSFEFEKE